MSESEASEGEGAWGWIRTAALAALVAAGPLWALTTVIVIQLSPALNGTSLIVEDGVPIVSTATWGQWIYASGVVASWMCFALPFVLAVITLGRFGWEAWRLRERAERARYDAMVVGDAVIDDPEWHAEATPPAAAPDPGSPSAETR